MKKSELRKIIAEEVGVILNENSPARARLEGVNSMIAKMETSSQDPSAYDLALRQALVYLAEAIALIETNKGAE